jgi:hypothetical protein
MPALLASVVIHGVMVHGLTATATNCRAFGAIRT